MKNSIILMLLLFLAVNIANAKTYTITNSGFSFSPATLTIALGDTVIFSLASIHNAVEVDQSTWNANGNTSNGGFSTADGGGMVIINSIGIHYYVCFYHASMGMKGTITVNAVTDVKLVNQTIPDNFILMQNYPNPFNPATTINYSIPKESFVTIKVYDVLGREVSTLVNEVNIAGNYSVQFNGSKFSTGIYFYRMQAGNFVQIKKLVLMK